MIKLFKKLNLWEWLTVFLIIGLIITQVQFDLELPEKMGEIVALIQVGGTTSKIWDVGFKMLAIAFASVSLTVVVSLLAAIVAARLGRKLRRLLFRKVNSFSMEELNDFSTSSLITRTTNDITQIQQTTMMMLRLLITAPTMAIGAILKIINKNLTLSYVTGIAIVILLTLIALVFGLVIPKFKLLQTQIDKINSVTRENLTGLRVVRAHNAEQLEEDKFDKVNVSLTKTQLFINRSTAIMMPGMQLIFSGLSLSIIWIGAYLINDGDLTLSNMVIFTQYAIQVLFSFMMLFMLFIFLPRASVSAKRINEVLRKKTTIHDGKGAQIDDENRGTVEFKDVNFRYPNAEDYILKNINLKINKGETVAFVGSTGSGKSTVINLIPRFYDTTSGEVLVDGINVKEYKLKDLYALLGYVPQKGSLFSGTVLSNITYGVEEATDDEVLEALQISQADFVYEFEEKTAHNIAQGGKNVSGGQRQRLSIARAIIKKPEIYIFDDSFSALDYKTDRELRKALKEKTKGATNLIVAQRIGTILDADKIVVLENGQIVGIGTHKELMKNCKVYQEIAFSQLSKEELE